VTKFLGKFRKNKEYHDDYNFAVNRRHKNEHAEIKKLLSRDLEEELEELEASLPQDQQEY
jgi:predicted secreted Zn-dependent protease